MLETHLSLEDFEGFLKGGSRPPLPEHNARVLRHLLRDCPVCRDRLSTLDATHGRSSLLFSLAAEASAQTGEEPSATQSPRAASYDYDQAFAGADQSITAFLMLDAPEMEKPADRWLAELTGLPEAEQVERVRAVAGYAHPLVIRELVERSHSSRYRGPQEMLHFANLARLAAERMPAPSDGAAARKAADLMTRVWGQYGSALRVCSRPYEAHEGLAKAQAYRLQGTGDPALRAWMLGKLTSLAISEERLREAVQLAEEGGEIFRELGDNQALAGLQTQKAVALIYSGETEAALRALHQAIPLIEYGEDPYLLLSACHNLIRCYIDLDRPDQALMLYSEIREIYKDFDDPLILLKTSWQEGKLLCDLGHLRAAETILLRTRKGYMEKGIPAEVALVSLDLATVYVKLGLVDEVKRTVITTLPIFHALRVKLDTLAALLQLQQVADQEQQALEIVRALSSRIESLPKKHAA